MRDLKIGLGWIVFLFACFSFMPEAFPDNTGVSYIGIKHKGWPCDKSIKALELASEINFGTLIDDTFGKEYQCLEKVLKLPKLKEVRFHAANCTCFPERGRKCHKDEVFAGMTQAQADKAIRAKQPGLILRYTQKLAKAKILYKDALISPCMESGLSRQARQTMLTLAEDYFPKSQIFDNPFGDSCAPGYGCEIHGDKKSTGRYTIDLDGISYAKINLTNFVTNNKRAIFALLWDFYFNCIDTHNKNFVSPPLRNCNLKNDVVWQYLRQLLAPGAMIPNITSPLNPNDLKNCRKREWNSTGDALWKQSDTWPGATYIHPIKFKKVVIKKNGKTETLKDGGRLPAPDNRYIYRSNTPTWQTPDNSVIITGKDCFVVEETLLRKD